MTFNILNKTPYNNNYSFYLNMIAIGSNLIVHGDITGNCQLWCFSHFAQFINNTNNTREQKLGMLMAARQQANKNLLMIDIRSDQDNIEDYILKSAIMHKLPYTSTNNSRMNMYLINTSGTWVKSK